MYARTVDEAQSRLVELRQEEWGALGLSALALAVSLAATRLYPPLVLPLFAGGLVVGMRGIRALWCRWDLVARLRMLSDFTASPLLNPALPSDGLESRVSKIRAGFRPRRSG